jgi:hypothetical protein
VNPLPPPPDAAIVIDPAAFVTVMPEPAVIVAAEGSLLVLPMRSCPLVRVLDTKALEPSATRIPWAVGFDTPEPPYVGLTVVPCHVPVPIVPIDVKDDKVVTAVFTKVPVVGNVTFVEPVVVSVRGFAPDVVRSPANVIVCDPLFSPVPPFTGNNGVLAFALIEFWVVIL